MTSIEWTELLDLIPIEQHSQIIFMLRSGVEINIDMVLRMEPEYLIFRGRASGSTDDGRVFFLPYSEITCAYLNRFVKESEIAEIFGDINLGRVEAELTEMDEESEIMAQPPTAALAVNTMTTPASVPTTASPRVTPTAVPRVAPAAPVAAKPATALIPPTAPAGNAPAPKGGSILERLRAQRGNTNRPR